MVMSIADAINQIASTHNDLSHNYGCRASLTTVTFLHRGMAHRARRFFRADMPGTGKIEIYVLDPYDTSSTCNEFGWYESAFSEGSMLRYVREDGRSELDWVATSSIDHAMYGDGWAEQFAERVQQLEML